MSNSKPVAHRESREESRRVEIKSVVVAKDTLAIKRSMTVQTRKTDGSVISNAFEDQAVIKERDYDAWLNGCVGLSRHGKYNLVLLNDVLIEAISKQSRAPVPLLMITSPAEFGLTREDVWLLKNPFDAVMSGASYRLASSCMDASHYVEFDADSKQVGHLPRAITFDRYTGLVTPENYDLDKAMAHLQSLPNVGSVFLNDNRQAWWPEGRVGIHSLDFTFWLDTETYRAVSARARELDEIGYERQETFGRAVLELDALGLRAAGAAFANTAADLVAESMWDNEVS